MPPDSSGCQDRPPANHGRMVGLDSGARSGDPPWPIDGRTLMKPNQSVPPATVVPILVYPDVRAAVDWLAGAFGFRERVRIGESHRAQLSVGADGAVIVGDVHGEQLPPEAGRVTHIIRVRVDDVDGHHARAKDFGAPVL